MATQHHRVFVSNPRSSSGDVDVVVRGKTRYYLIVPIAEDLFEIHFDGKYLGESGSLSGAERFINRGGADAPVLIQQPNGGLKMYKYKSPSSNPKKKKK